MTPPTDLADEAALEPSGRLAEAGAPAAPLGPAGPLVPMIIGAALFMQTLDATVVSNALPTMARALHRDPVTLNLAITAYLLASAVFLPISAWVGDRFGSKTVFRAAIVGFALSSLLCGLSQTLPELVAARLLQGVAGAMMTPVGRLLLLRTVPKAELVRALSYLTMPALLGPMLGPPVGGFIVTFSSWRWIFFINIPMGVLGVVLTTLFVPEVRETVRERLDVRGFILSGLALAGVVYGFDNLGRGLLPPLAVAGMILAGSLFALLYARHAKTTPHPILDLSLLRIRTYAAATLGGLLSRLINGSSPFLLALLLQVGFGLSALSAGLLTFAAAAGALVMKTTAQPILSRFGFRTVLVGNALLVAGASALYAGFTATTPHWLLVIVLLVSGFFRSLQFTSLNALAYADIPTSSMSRASSMASMFQQIAQSLGVGLAALLVHAFAARGAPHPLAARDISPAFVVIALVSLLALFFFARLPPGAGAEVSGRAGPG